MTLAAESSEIALRAGLAVLCRVRVNRATAPETVANLALCQGDPERAQAWAARNVVIDWSPEYEFDECGMAHHPVIGPKPKRCCGRRLRRAWDYCPRCGVGIVGEDIDFGKVLAEEKAKARSGYLERVSAAILAVGQMTLGVA